MQEDLKNVKSRLSRINSYLTKIEERILVEESITTKPVATLLEEYQLIGKHQVALMEAVRRVEAQDKDTIPVDLVELARMLSKLGAEEMKKLKNSLMDLPSNLYT